MQNHLEIYSKKNSLLSLKKKISAIAGMKYMVVKEYKKLFQNVNKKIHLKQESAHCISEDFSNISSLKIQLYP